MKYQIEKKQGYCVVSFDGELFHASELASYIAAAPQIGADIPPGDGVVISGRGPVWLYAALVHHFHPAAWVATFDPRLAGGVVTQRHVHLAPPIGEVISL